MEQQLLYGAYKMPNEFTYGYSSGGATLSGFSRGDGTATLLAFTVFQSLIVAQQAVPVLQFATALKGENGSTIMKTAPTLAQYATVNPPKTPAGKAELALLLYMTRVSSSFDVPVGTPVKYQAALTAAFQFAENSGDAKTRLLANGLGGGGSPSLIRTSIDYIISHQALLARWLQATGAPPAGYSIGLCKPKRPQLGKFWLGSTSQASRLVSKAEQPCADRGRTIAQCSGHDQ